MSFNRLKTFFNKSKNSKETEINSKNDSEMYYYSTDKDMFVKAPNNTKIYLRTNTSISHVDNCDSYLNNRECASNGEKHVSDNSYFTTMSICPQTILDYRKKLQETGIVLNNSYKNYTEDVIEDIIEDELDCEFNNDLDCEINNDLDCECDVDVIDDYLNMYSDGFEKRVTEIDPYVKDYFIYDEKLEEKHKQIETIKQFELQNWIKKRNEMKKLT
jgi:hypothetical protein